MAIQPASPDRAALGAARSTLARWTVALWLPAAIAVSVAGGTAYGVGQHVTRSAANDPQIQLAEDAARALTGGADPAAVAAGPPVDLATSLAVEISVQDDAGTVIAATGSLDGAPARPPLGALDAATISRPNVVTWQPRHGVRMAAVVARYSGRTGSGTVVVARSLRVAEERDTQLLALVCAGWAAGLVVTGVASFAGAWLLLGRRAGHRRPGAAP